VPVKLWDARTKRAVWAAIQSALAGVGDVSRRHVEYGDLAIHVRRPMTELEAASLPQHPDKPGAGCPIAG
jgi:hypothetical protein